MHDFPADGLYSFRLNISGGTGTQLEDLDVSIDGERVALLHYESGVDQNLASADSPAGADYIRSEPIADQGRPAQGVGGVRSPHRRSVRRSDQAARLVEGVERHGERRHDRAAAPDGDRDHRPAEDHGHLRDAEPQAHLLLPSDGGRGAARVRRADPHAARQRGRIVVRSRRTIATGLMSFYTKRRRGRRVRGRRAHGAAGDALEPVLRLPLRDGCRRTSRPARTTRSAIYELASRLSFFLWGSIPDEQLLTLAQQHKLSEQKDARRAK